jgi:hypothetical protein
MVTQTIANAFPKRFQQIASPWHTVVVLVLAGLKCFADSHLRESRASRTGDKSQSAIFFEQLHLNVHFWRWWRSDCGYAAVRCKTFWESAGEA